MIALLLVAIVVGGLVVVVSKSGGSSQKQQAVQLDDAITEARRWIDRLGSQVLSLSGTDSASTQALADASERFNAASSQISQAQSVRQAELARESALEGLHYVNATREIMGLPAGPELPPLEGQRAAGKVTEQRTIEHEGHSVTASPTATAQTPNYYPGGMVAGRPVPAGWYSEPWWAGALRSGMWTAGSVLLFSSLFNGMSGVGYSAHAFESGYGDGFQDGLAAAEGAGDAGDVDAAGDFGDMGDGLGGFDGFDGFDFDF
ncbi:hypothetical protein BKD74_04960 [Corynebacterium diphtheriae]|uniref:hypothetical protein n=1 Tax=Corynebacterium diphtheriae TaxID=1717 RepID=UPI0009297C4C|nr:hypothetical protein [Corynebacterium diphtheriae]MBG9256646.1 DUF1542 domain-containing protein [Corynebacterium diphtheriae bv. mitis]OJH94509.1 hypothetical protein BKD74_04960 [Corynebacterium diphtheriae]CAB0562681.1 hypothetical protein CIP107517_01741 [Corynebacterium diphtheriae]